MSATERVAAFGSRSTISGWAAISPSRKSSRFAHHRVHRRLDYPASLGLDPAGDARLLDLRIWIAFPRYTDRARRTISQEDAMKICSIVAAAIIGFMFLL